MTTEQQDLLTITKNYLQAIEEGKTGDELAVFYSPSVEQIEYPNCLIPTGAKRNLNDSSPEDIRLF